MPDPTWIYAYASATGSSHVAEQTPCQDYCRLEHHPHFSIAIVCDGAGSCAHSDVGAKAVSEFALFHFQHRIKSLGWDTGEVPSQEDWHAMAKIGLKETKNDLENFSLNSGFDYKSMSCTIIVAIVLKNALLITHIGDGRAGYCNGAEEWFHLLTPFRGKEANETVFLTSDIWDDTQLDTFVESRIVTEKIKAFCLMTDGCEKASFECNLYDEEKAVFYDPNQPYAPFFHKNINDHLPSLWVLGTPQVEINALWQQFLEAGNEKLRNEPDDKTMVLAVRLPELTLSTDAQTGTS